MTRDEQIQICKILSVSCMWGHGGICSVILDELDKKMPMESSWRQTFNDGNKEAEREHIGVITDEKELLSYLRRGYWLVNGDSLFNPPPMNGLCKYVAANLYKKYAGPSLQSTTQLPSWMSW